MRGMTNKKDWDQFVRSKERFRLHDLSAKNKVEYFNLWLDCDKSWDSAVAAVKRKQSQKNKASKGWTAIQGKTLRTQLTAEKFTTLTQSRVQNGLYYDDDDFPGDEDETLTCLVSYFVQSFLEPHPS